MGWLVGVDFKASPVQGMGVFARRSIAAGTRIWQFDDSMQVCDRNAMDQLTPSQIAFALHGGYLHGPSDRFLWYTDGMQYMNHAAGQGANIGLGFWPALREDHTMALRDIEAGEELLEDYTFWANDGTASDHWLHSFYMRHGREHYNFLMRLKAQPVAA